MSKKYNGVLGFTENNFLYFIVNNINIHLTHLKQLLKLFKTPCYLSKEV